MVAAIIIMTNINHTGCCWEQKKCSSLVGLASISAAGIAKSAAAIAAETRLNIGFEKRNFAGMRAE